MNNMNKDQIYSLEGMLTLNLIQEFKNRTLVGKMEKHDVGQPRFPEQTPNESDAKFPGPYRINANDENHWESKGRKFL